MSKEMSMKDYFHFKFRNYNLNPKDNLEHRKFFAKRKIINQDINDHIKKFELDLKSESSPKRIYWGDPGVGKSHTMLHIVSFLEEKGFEFVYIECPPLMKASKFIELFKIFLNQYGKKRILELIDKTNNYCREQAQNNNPEFYKKPDEFAYPYLKKYFLDDDFIEVAKRIAEPQEHNNIWNWLQGAPMKGVITDSLEENITKLKDVFLAILKMSDEIAGKKLILVFDELDKAAILNPEHGELFAFVFQHLTDDSQTHAVVIFGFTAESLEESSVINANVLRRVRGENQIHIPQLTAGELQDFVKDLIQYNREDNYNPQNEIEKYKNDADGEKIDSEYYPFTFNAIEKLRAKMSRSKPGDLLGILNRACASCQGMNKHIVTSKFIDEVAPSGAVSSR